MMASGIKSKIISVAIVVFLIMMVTEEANAAGYYGSTSGKAACVASFEGNITFLRDHCKSGFRKTHWWQWGRSCWARCCKNFVSYVDGGKDEFDKYCGPWTS